MAKEKYEREFLTFSEIKDEFPKAAADWGWTAKMFFYFSKAGLIRRQFNESIKCHEYDKKSLLSILSMVNKGLDDIRINFK
jgi:hypothetical protein